MLGTIKREIGHKLVKLGSEMISPPKGVCDIPNLAGYKTRPRKAEETLLTKSVDRFDTHQHARELFDRFKDGDSYHKMLEVGGSFSKNSQSLFPEFEYYNLDIEDSSAIPTIVGDITKENTSLEAGSFDLIVSHQTFEHINQPWLAAKEMSRLLKPGGFCYVSTHWAWRYHPVPIDYWRFSPDCLAFLFEDLVRIEANFNSSHRRMDIRGIWPNLVDAVPVDAFGGWRENWFVYYFGQKARDLT